jgi:hypothetical protein
VELGLAYTATGWYADALQFRCFHNPVIVSLDIGPAGVHPLQLEAVERLAAERAYAVHHLTIRAASWTGIGGTPPKLGARPCGGSGRTSGLGRWTSRCRGRPPGCRSARSSGCSPPG